MRDDDLMPFFLPIHFEPREFGQLYADYGFFAIMKLTRFEDDYQWAVLQLARGPLYRGDPYGARGLHAARGTAVPEVRPGTPASHPSETPGT